tara:strand:- start:5635 stop:6171 length:537 start_codon:yes stop_codon:yes gene_type:complete
MSTTNIIFFASGCFWCTEAVFKRVKGVIAITPGYIDGTIKNPAYREVCSGRTGHAECVKIEYDSTIVNLNVLLAVNFSTHDPTTLNRQGYDVGTQYRSGIYFSTEQQEQIIQEYVAYLENEKVFDNSIVTEIKPAETFYSAETEHHDYYDQNLEQRYCEVVIAPKIAKLRASFVDYLK